MKFALRGITPVVHQITPEFHQVTPEFSPFKNAKNKKILHHTVMYRVFIWKTLLMSTKTNLHKATPRKLDKALGSSFPSCKVIKYALQSEVGGGRTDSHHFLHKGVTLSIKAPVKCKISAKTKKRLKLHNYAVRQNWGQNTGKNAFAHNRQKFQYIWSF